MMQDARADEQGDVLVFSDDYEILPQEESAQRNKNNQNASSLRKDFVSAPPASDASDNSNSKVDSADGEVLSERRLDSEDNNNNNNEDKDNKDNGEEEDEGPGSSALNVVPPELRARVGRGLHALGGWLTEAAEIFGEIRVEAELAANSVASVANPIWAKSCEVANQAAEALRPALQEVSASVAENVEKGWTSLSHVTQEVVEMASQATNSLINSNEEEKEGKEEKEESVKATQPEDNLEKSNSANSDNSAENLNQNSTPFAV